MNKINSIEDLYLFAKEKGIEKQPFGIGITAGISEDYPISEIELLSPMQLSNIEIVTKGEYWHNNKKVYDNFVWLYMIDNEPNYC